MLFGFRVQGFWFGWTLVGSGLNSLEFLREQHLIRCSTSFSSHISWAPLLPFGFRVFPSLRTFQDEWVSLTLIEG